MALWCFFRSQKKTLLVTGDKNKSKKEEKRQEMFWQSQKGKNVEPPFLLVDH